MIEKIKILRDNKQFCAAILTDLSKAFDCIPNDLLIAQLIAYGFDQEALKKATDHKELKWVLHLVSYQIFRLEILKVQYLVHYYLI